MEAHAEYASDGRSMTIIYLGDEITIREGIDGALEFAFGIVRAIPESKTFEAATNEARKWMLARG